MKECCQQAAQAAWDEGNSEGDLAQYSGRPSKPNPYRSAEVPATPEEPS